MWHNIFFILLGAPLLILAWVVTACVIWAVIKEIRE